MKYGFLRAACASPSLKVGDCMYNANRIINVIKEADSKKVSLLVLPELTITGYTCQDLFLQKTLRQGSIDALIEICKNTEDTDVLCAIGLPFELNDVLYNCAAFIYQGSVIAIIPKTFIPNYSEFYEKRWFTPAPHNKIEYVDLTPEYNSIPFGTNIIIQDETNPIIRIACEICEDLWVPMSPSVSHTLHGATVIANLSASNEVVGKAQYRKDLVSAHSAKTLCAYLYADASHDESTTDMVFSAHNIIALNGSIKAEQKPFECCDELLITDLDIEKIQQDRLKTTTFARSKEYAPQTNYITLFVELSENVFFEDESAPLLTKIEQNPFVPESDGQRAKRCSEVIQMQAEGLAKRLRHINASSAVIGLSGGLDSTLALLITEKAFDLCGISRDKIVAITMPAFGTTDRTYNNACTLARTTGATLKEINIKKAVLQHFEDIGQDSNTHDITYENSQARERTQVLMDAANKTGGIVIGTGDLSELALGWCTYNGDHMSMYGVNASIPKTLVRYLVQYFANAAAENGKTEESNVLLDILATPVSPELIPPKDGQISQKTEDIVGPYELHDFYLYYVLRFGFTPSKIFFLACHAFGEKYSRQVLKKWLVSFYKRFFSQQFKRSCMPDGAKVGTVSLSPRGDWRMSSDALSTLWINEAEGIKC